MSLAVLVEIFLLSFSIRMSLSGKFTDWSCLGHRSSPWTSDWLTVPLELHALREVLFPKRMGDEQRKHRVSMTQWSVPFVSRIFLFLGPFFWGAYQNSSETCVITFKAQLHEEVTITCHCLVTFIETTSFSCSRGCTQTPLLFLTVLFWEAVRQAGPGWVRGSVLSLTSSVTPDRPFNLSETYFPYLRVTELLCASTKVSTKYFVQCKVPFWW